MYANRRNFRVFKKIVVNEDRKWKYGRFVHFVHAYGIRP